jgi:hypothetical protein
MDGFTVLKKKDKKPYTLFVFQNHGDQKMQHLAFHSYKNHISTVQGVWMFCPKKGHILYCAVHYYFRLAGGETLEKKTN